MTARGRRSTDTGTGPGGPQGRRVLLALGILAGVPAASQTMLVPVFPELEDRLGRGPVDSAWLLTAFLVSASVAAPVLGRLGDLRGRRRLLLATAATYTTGALLCWAAVDHFALLVVGRILQGASAGAYVLTLATVNEVFARHRRSRGIGVLAAVVGVGPVLGFVVGGVAARLGGVELLLAVAPAAGLVALGSAWLWVPDSGGAAVGRLDRAGALLLGLSLAGLLVLLSELAGPRPVAHLLVLGGVAAASTVLWVLVERRRVAPLVDLRLVLGPVQARLNAATATSGGAMLALLVIVPRMVQEPVGSEPGLGPLGAVLVLVPGASMIALLTPVGVLWGARIGHRHVVKIGALVTALGFAVLIGADGSLAVVVLGTAVTAAGLGFTLGTLPALVLDSTPPARSGEAAGANSMSRGVGSALGAQLSGVALTVGAVAGSFDRALAAGALLAVATTALIGRRAG